MATAELSLKDFHVASPNTLELDKVCVEGLEMNVNAGFDGFGRPKAQPVSINATVYLNQVVSSAASIDILDRSTLHYGELSKTLLKQIDQLSGEWQQPQAFLDHLNSVIVSFASNRSAIARIDLKVQFKSSSVTNVSGSSLWSLTNYASNNSCSGFSIDNMLLPALIGVNDHERTMRQQITIAVTIDRLNEVIANECYQAEQIIVKTIEESAFETLEALCESVAANLIKYFILARKLTNPSLDAVKAEPAGVRVRIGKPFAIAFAQSATVEIYRSAGLDDAFGRRMQAELGSKRPQIPFPLKSRLDEFLRSWKQD